LNPLSSSRALLLHFSLQIPATTSRAAPVLPLPLSPVVVFSFSLRDFRRENHASPLPPFRLASGHAAPAVVPLSVSLQLFRRPSTTTRGLLPPTLGCHRTFAPPATLLRPPSLHLHFVREHFPFFAAIVAPRFLEGKFLTRFFFVFCFVYVNFQF